MSLVYLPATQRCPLGSPDPAERVTVTIAGVTFDVGRRTAAHLEWTIAELAEAFPVARLVILQTCYHEGVALSAGTHDGDGVLDIQVVGLSWSEAQAWLRAHGWAAWWRHTGSWLPVGKWHIHMVSLGCPGPVGEFIPGQVSDYYADRSGLVGHVMDDTPHPHPQLIFDYTEWIDAMPLNPADLAAVKALFEATIPDIVKAVLAAPVDKDGTSLRQAVRQAAKNGVPA